MGGHHSTQSVNDVFSVMSSAVQTMTSSCQTSVAGGNLMINDGTDIIANNNTQSMTVAVSASCAAGITQAAGFQSQLATQVVQGLNDSEQGMTQWMDNSRDTSSTSITQDVSTNVTSASVQTCVTSINAQNIMSNTGTGIVADGNDQATAVSAIAKCMMNQGQTSTVAANAATTVNQHSVYKSVSPFAFITDALQSIMKSAFAAIAGIFIVIICFIGLVVALHHMGKKKSSGTKTGGGGAAGGDDGAEDVAGYI